MARPPSVNLDRAGRHLGRHSTERMSRVNHDGRLNLICPRMRKSTDEKTADRQINQQTSRNNHGTGINEEADHSTGFSPVEF
jgi:hypothetical protein